MTDSEIIKAFEICYTGDEEDCLKCPFCDEDGECMDGGDSKLLEEVGYLLNRQKAEIEVLKTNNHSLSMTLSNRARVERAEAIKEFAERLKDKAYEVKGFYEVVDVKDIDNLVKEMVGD